MIVLKPINVVFMLLFICTLLLIDCAHPLNVNVLIRMFDSQAEYFKKNVIHEFATEHKVNIDVLDYVSVDSVTSALMKNTGECVLVKIPFDQGIELVRAGLLKPLEDILTTEEIGNYLNTYLLTDYTVFNGKHYFIPRKFETRIMVYRKSKVLDAVSLWRKYQGSISKELERFNSFGLPSDYILEADPCLWDFYDIFVTGWIWAHTIYDGKIEAKIAHRGKNYSGTAQRIVDRIFQCGGDSVTVMTMSGKAVQDAIHWESVYTASGVYNDRFLKEEWSGQSIWEGFRDECVFLSFMTQIDCFYIHGTGQDGLDGYLSDPEDLGVSVMPLGCSVELDSDGIVSRIGCRCVTTGGWWWGIPSGTPDPVLSYKLATKITNLQNQIEGCSRFGMIPVRKDVLGDMSMLFGDSWISDIYETSFRQLMHNKDIHIPLDNRYSQILNLYMDLWKDIVVSGNWNVPGKDPDISYISKVISDVYIEKAEDVLKGSR